MASIRTYLVSSAAHDFRSSLEKWIQGLRPYLIALFDFLISNLVSSLYILDVDPDPGVCLANALPALRVTCAAPGTTFGVQRLLSCTKSPLFTLVSVTCALGVLRHSAATPGKQSSPRPTSRILVLVFSWESHGFGFHADL